MAAKKSLQARIKAGDRSAIKQALANPKWRRYVPDKYAPASVRQHRQANVKKAALNKRLDTPITPGSTTTERDLARESQAAMDVKYGPLEAEQRKNVGMAEAAVRDVGGWYDQYLAQLQGHQQAVQQIGQQASAQMQG